MPTIKQLSEEFGKTEASMYYLRRTESPLFQVYVDAWLQRHPFLEYVEEGINVNSVLKPNAAYRVAIWEV